MTMGRAPIYPEGMVQAQVDKRWNSREKKKASRALLVKPPRFKILLSRTSYESLCGPKGRRIWDFSKDLTNKRRFRKKRGHYSVSKTKKSNPKRLLKGLKKGIGLMKKGDVTVGKAPKTLPETLKTKKDRHILLRDADEAIAEIKQKINKPLKILKRNFTQKSPINSNSGMAELRHLVGEPSYAADFYDDRTPMKKGKKAPYKRTRRIFKNAKLASNPEYIAKYFPNVVTEGPSGPLYDVNYDL